MRTFRLLSRLVLVAVGLGLTGCGGGDADTSPTRISDFSSARGSTTLPSPTADVEAARKAEEVAAMGPLDQMVIAFADPPLKAELQSKLDAALLATETPITDENYSRAGSTLVTFRREHGSDEMRVLECIPEKARDPRLPEVSFPNAAALCSLIVSRQLPR